MSNLLSSIARLAAVAITASLVLAGCGEADGGSNTSFDQIDAQEAQWDAKEITNYVMEYRVRCLCPTTERRVLVSAGRIERFDYKAEGEEKYHYDDDYRDDRDYEDYYDHDYAFTATRLFKLARDAHESAHSVKVVWHPDLGVPSDIRIDWRNNGINDKYQIVLTRLEAR